MQIEVGFFDLRTVFYNFNCSLACVRNTVSGVSLGFLHSPAFSWARRDVRQDLYIRTGLAVKKFLLAYFILS